MHDKLTLTANQQTYVDAMLGAEPSTVAPVSNRALAQLVDEYEVRNLSFRTRTNLFLGRTGARLATVLAVSKRYGIIKTLFLVCYWRVSLRDILYRTERKFELIYFKEE